jgi:hypothetical protein
MASGGSITSCQTPVSTLFIFNNVAAQNAADSIYVAKNAELASSISGLPGAPSVRHDVNLIFKSDYERMQYLMGLYGRTAQGRR